jgi:hypothetical protein
LIATGFKQNKKSPQAKEPANGGLFRIQSRGMAGAWRISGDSLPRI